MKCMNVKIRASFKVVSSTKNAKIAYSKCMKYTFTELFRTEKEENDISKRLDDSYSTTA